jgi:NitT/TauT family transport system substrate-binding protein
MIRTRTFAGRVIGFGLAVLSVFILSTVAYVAPGQAQITKLEPVRISRIPIAPYVPTDLAMARGWFKDAGLDVTVGAVAGGSVTMQALISDKLDLIYTALDAAIKARSQGFDVVIVANNNTAQLKPPDAAALIVRKDSGITNLKQLEGKRVLVNNLDNVNWAFTREAIAKAGGDPSKVQFLELDFPQMDDAVLARRAEAASGTEPFTTIGVGTGKLAVLSYMFVDVQPGLNIAGWVARESWVKQHPQTVAAFRRVLQRSIDLLESSPEERTKAILEFTPLKEPLLKKITLDKWTTKLDVADLQKQIEIYKRNGMIDKTFDAKTLIAP